MKPFVLLILLTICASCSPLNNKYHEEDRGAGKADKAGIEKLVALKNGSQYSLQAQWVGGPYGNINQFSEILVFIYDENKKLVALPDGLSLQFFATMPSMGHPLDHPGYFKELSPGIYKNSEITFNMPGDWQMEISIYDRDNLMVDQVLWLEYF